MKKRLLIAAMGVSLFLGGCINTQMELEYEGKVHDELRLEERLEDELEAENPGYDLEVDIIEEADE